MKYISLFSGIGGLEHPFVPPAMFCESDPASQRVLRAMFGEEVEIWPDVSTFPSRRTDVIAGGWPCQDITVAGRMRGLTGRRSGLFFEMVKIGRMCRAHTIVGENVPNLLTNRVGRDFRLVIDSLQDGGYRHVAWRVLDARQFGLPQARRRLFIVASRNRERAMSLHRPVTRAWVVKPRSTKGERGETYGFYWTGGGGRSLCLQRDTAPPLKVGSSTSKGTSPVGVFVDGIVRKLTPFECLRLQGFWDTRAFEGHILGDIFRMAGNAVAKPVGAFVMGGIEAPTPERVEWLGSSDSSGSMEAGYTDGKTTRGLRHDETFPAMCFGAYLEDGVEPLSPQASAGLLTRIIRARRWIPPAMFDALYARSRRRTRLIGTRINSFEILDEQMRPLEYRRWLETASVDAERTLVRRAS